MKHFTTSDDILGKEAVDPHGAVLGVITKLHINKETKELAGMTIDQGLLKPDLFIGTDFIKYFGVDAVLLNKVPEDRYKGLNVIDSKGTMVGKVKDFTLDNKKLKEIIIIFKESMFTKKERVIFPSDIKEIGESIVLKKEFEDK